jgi:hypothetical protein
MSRALGHGTRRVNWKRVLITLALPRITTSYFLDASLLSQLLGLPVLDLQRRLVLQFSLGTLGHTLGKVLLRQR